MRVEGRGARGEGEQWMGHVGDTFLEKRQVFTLRSEMPEKGSVIRQSLLVAHCSLLTAHSSKPANSQNLIQLQQLL